jgi:PmbA protein
MRLFGERFTLDSLGDDPLLMNCGCADDEGTPTRVSRIVEGGVFRNYVTSRRSALRTGLPATGNGFRTPLFDEDMSEALVRDRLGGMEMAAGTRSMEELVASMERGVVLFELLGLHGADKARGRFSTTACGGFAVLGGKVVGRLAPGHWSIAGRVFDEPEGASIFADVEPSRERVLTGTGRMPWLLAHVDVV